MDKSPPAFPRPYSEYTDAGGLVEYICHEQSGMSLRDYFAAAAVVGYMSNPTSGQIEDGINTADPVQLASVTAVFAYLVADAMLKAREMPASTEGKARPVGSQ